MAQTTWKQVVLDTADAIREANGTSDKIPVGQIADKVRAGAGTPYEGDNPLTIGAEGYNFPAKTLLKDGLQIINGVNGEDLTEPIAEQEVAVADLLTMVGRKLADHKGEGQYVWKKLTAEGGDFIDYVVSSDTEAYPDGGELDGYWYEIYETAEPEKHTYGIFFNEVNQYFNPLDCEMVFGENIPENQFYVSSPASNWWGACKNLRIKAINISSYAFYNFFKYFSGKLKIDAYGLLKGQAFAYIGASANAAPKIWISNTCQTIYCSSSYANAPFMNCKTGTTIYCEATSKPSGWDSSWLYRAYNDALTVTWGVTEEEFNAL